MLYSQVVPVQNINVSQRKEMFLLLEQYYEKVQWDRFLIDLNDKDDVILLFEQKSKEIKGFSTLKNIEIKHNNRKYIAVFSGDTVIDQAFWGQRLLGKAFLKYLLIQKLKNPFQPFYWILVSKGFKTYLLMANNFPVHYPRYEYKTPSEMQKLMDAFAIDLFADAYQPETGLIQFSESLGQLRHGIAEVPIIGERNPRIHYFIERNPDWSKGAELMCIAKMSLAMPFMYQIKSIWKKYIRFGQNSTNQASMEPHK